MWRTIDKFVTNVLVSDRFGTNLWWIAQYSTCYGQVSIVPSGCRIGFESVRSSGQHRYWSSSDCPRVAICGFVYPTESSPAKIWREDQLGHLLEVEPHGDDVQEKRQNRHLPVQGLRVSGIEVNIVCWRYCLLILLEEHASAGLYSRDFFPKIV